MGEERCRSETGLELEKGGSGRSEVERGAGGNDRGQSVHGKGKGGVILDVATV